MNQPEQKKEVEFKKICPTCGGVMSNFNTFCSLRCANAKEGQRQETD